MWLKPLFSAHLSSNRLLLEIGGFVSIIIIVTLKAGIRSGGQCWCDPSAVRLMMHYVFDWFDSGSDQNPIDSDVDQY